MHIKESHKIKHILNEHADIKSILINDGLKEFANPFIIKSLENKSLKEVCESKNINTKFLVNHINDFLDSEVSEDITLNEKEFKSSDIRVSGLLPCPLKGPLLEMAGREFGDGYSFNLVAASMGLDFMKEDLEEGVNSKGYSKFDHIYISAGFDFFFHKKNYEKFNNKEQFINHLNLSNVNDDLKEIVDPKGIFTILTLVPSVFYVNEKQLASLGVAIPNSWEELLNGNYEGLISMPIKDFDLFSSILLHINKDFGIEGIKNLSKAYFKSLHPSQMVSSKEKEKPPIGIMPYFFSTVLNDPQIKTIWPKDGSIISPVFALSKKGDTIEEQEKIKRFMEALVQDDLCEIFEKNRFPSINGNTKNKMTGNKFKFLGWDYIDSHDLGTLSKDLENIFFGRS